MKCKRCGGDRDADTSSPMQEGDILCASCDDEQEAYENRYDLWIEEHYPTKELCNLQCSVATLQMVKAFPELKRVRGYYHDCLQGKRPHWWCVMENGEILDPTNLQFSDKGILGEYEPWDESRPEPKGKCMNCGELCYENANSCSDACSKILDELYNPESIRKI